MSALPIDSINGSPLAPEQSNYLTGFFAGLAARGRLYVSPATILELQILMEAGRVRLSDVSDVAHVARDDRWVVDDPSSAAWFDAATAVSWTRDPFDRLLVAHARIRKWRIATGDAAVLEHLRDDECIEL